MARQIGSPVEVMAATANLTDKVSHRRGWVYLLLFLVAVINFIDRVVISVNAQPIAKEFNLTPIALGYLFSSYLWTYTLCQIPVGFIVDRWGGRLPLAIGVGLWSFATMLTGAATNFATILITRLGLGMGESVSMPAGSQVLREWAPSSERGFAFALFNSGLYAGPAFGIVLVAGLTDLLGWRGAFFVTGAIGFVWVAVWLIWFRMPEKTWWLSDRERRKILGERTDRATTETKRGAGLEYLALLKSPSMWGVFLTMGCNVYTQYLFLAWLPTYLQTTRNLPIIKTGFYAAIPYAAAAVLVILISKFSDRILTPQAVRAGNRRAVIAVMMLCSSVLLLTPFVEALWLIVALFSISLAGIATAISLNATLMTDLVSDPKNQGKAMSILVIGGNTFGMSAPIITGYVIDATSNYNWAFFIAGMLLIVGAISVLTATRRPIG
jgi:MFS family permease